MLKALKEMLAQKKFQAALIAALVFGLGKLGLEIDSETLWGIVGPIMAYIVGQGVADMGKSKAMPVDEAPAALKAALTKKK